jgi:hypothetical protein
MNRYSSGGPEWDWTGGLTMITRIAKMIDPTALIDPGMYFMK